MNKNLLLFYTLVCAVNLYAADSSDLYQREPNPIDVKENPQEYWEESGKLFTTLNLYLEERTEFEKEFFLAYMAQSSYAGVIRRKAKLFNYLNNNIRNGGKEKALKEMIRAAKTDDDLDLFIQSLLQINKP